jgi:hypothetical protein
MRAARPLLAALAVAWAACAAPAQDALLSASDVGGDWKPLLGALAAKGPIQASFTERRHFPFRHEPLVLKGVLRISPERGLSLQYTDPEASVLVADASGLVLRDGKGRSREMPSGSREGGAIASLLPIMRFDLPALFPQFVIHARRAGDGWTFEFTPRDREVADSLGSITVSGTGTDVRHLEFRRSASQRVEIDVVDTRAGVAFTPAELARFFR